MNKKRTRSLNWDSEEKQLLRSVITEYAKIIEDKSVDTNTNKIKREAWGKVYKKFNEINSRYRDLSQLKIQWKSIKIGAKKAKSAYNRERNKTGDGPPPLTPSDSLIEINDLLNPAELLEDHNMYDSDGIVMSQDNATPAHTATPKERMNSVQKVLKRKIMSNNIQENDRKSSKNHNDYINDIISHSKMLKDREHRRRMEMAEEEHAIKMAINQEKLMSAKIERQILELKIVREQNTNNINNVLL